MSLEPVRKSIMVKATPARAFDVFVKDLDRWWPRKASIGASPMSATRIEPQVGGRWIETGEDGSTAIVGRVLVYEPPHRLVMSWMINAAWRPDASVASEVEVTFTPHGEGATLVALEHRGFAVLGAEGGAKMRGDVEGGWQGMLSLYGAMFPTP